jgi:dihydrofolate synthase/folylpolyglutamate synthase
MDYSSSLEYLYGLQHFGIKLGLENTRRLLERLDNPQRKLRIIHIAGTNGKGSTAAALERILRSHGLRTGLYTSPHLHSFTERIRIDNQPISEAEVVSQTEAIRACAEDLTPTFFEFTTAMALRVFALQSVDWVILETGLGGRLDSTNVVDPQLTIITPIALDHAAHLGETLALIAAEKAGIIKPGVPVISARQEPEALAVLQQRAEESMASFTLAGRDFSWDRAQSFNYRGLHTSLTKIETGLVGRYQRENISLAIAAAESLLGTLDASVTRQALAALRWAGRLEWCGDLLLDGAHNPHAAVALAEYLDERDIDDLLWVVALKSDKDARGILAPLLPRTARLLVTALEPEESKPAAELLAIAAEAGVEGEEFDSAHEALRRALDLRRPGQKILVAGSLFLVAALRTRSLELAGATT